MQLHNVLRSRRPGQPGGISEFPHSGGGGLNNTINLLDTIPPPLPEIRSVVDFGITDSGMIMTTAGGLLLMNSGTPGRESELPSSELLHIPQQQQQLQLVAGTPPDHYHMINNSNCCCIHDGQNSSIIGSVQTSMTPFLEMTTPFGEMFDDSDFECALCYRLYYRPVTTECGHTYCMSCLAKSIIYSPNCPICRRKLSYNNSSDFSVNITLASILEKYFMEQYKLREEEELKITPPKSNIVGHVEAPDQSDSITCHSWYWTALLCDN